MGSDSKTNLRNVYGRGFYDGMQAAARQEAKNTDKGEHKIMMSKARSEAVLNGLSSIAKKIYAAVPINEDWSHADIASEIGRVGVKPDLNIVSGCLNTLVDSGLVTEGKKGYFRRRPIRVSQPKADVGGIARQDFPIKGDLSLGNETDDQTVNAERKESPLDRLADLGSQINDLAGQLACLGRDFENAILELMEQGQKVQDDIAKFKQLQDLLKGIGR